MRSLGFLFFRVRQLPLPEEPFEGFILSLQVVFLMTLTVPAQVTLKMVLRRAP